MLKLLRADFSRLWKDRVFLLAAAILFLMGAGLPIIHFMDNRNNAAGWTPDASCFSYAFFLPVLLAALISLYIGSEYSDGTMRNKRTVGHRRDSIYLANLITCMAAGTMLCAAYLIPHTGFAIALLGKFESTPRTVLLYIALNLVLTFAFSSISVLIAMLCQNKAYSSAACILLVFALLFWGIRITSALNEPEYYSAYSYTENGVTVEAPDERNPNYLTGTKRQVYEFLHDFTPGGQVLQLANMDTEHHGRLALYSSLIVLVSTCGGVLAFRRKDLK